eukprot:CAMPEP_0198726394 /NCGR_PEP_ID=MMETSP1475-20131203/3448_1 /TAXON_ID= ORGANISM="Unidentified sp., Strain CCMP1999" /NCGR_SAMPLE_ID=MMETSP1475 /ASSEMBLY_ACC=CAM_ASM_001111 /LENGTH=512 /DNA_ID=CAMNT_0044488301 /DNA_START=20 /DNA_END=1558 /DNA_ORIENTATION=-
MGELVKERAEIGGPWPSRGRREVALPLQNDVVRVIMGHPRKHVPCVQLRRSQETDFEVTFQVGEEKLETFEVRNGRSEEWLDVNLCGDIADVVILVQVAKNKFELGRAAVLGSDFSAMQGVLRKTILGGAGVVGELFIEFVVMTSLSAGVKAKVERGISDIRPPRLAGHRGSGANGTAPINENTILSFVAATRNSLVSHVELDVQLTREGTPVIYHDFHISAGRKHGKKGRGIPLYALSIEEWSELDPPSLHDDASYYSDDDSPSLRSRTSAIAPFSQKGVNFKGSLHDGLPTLASVCKKCPSHVGMMIELKYPIPEFQEEMKLPYPSRDYFANRVLETVFEEAKNATRSIIFLTFDATLAMILKAKQSRFPVYFLCAERDEDLTDQLDYRSAALEHAIDYAENMHINGNVFAAKVLLQKKHVVPIAKQKKLAVMTYGKINSDPATVQQQYECGVDGIIADNVNLLITRMNRQHNEDLQRSLQINNSSMDSDRNGEDAGILSSAAQRLVGHV